ncbi:MAG: alpha-ketoacid dehydrogenase subunit beta [Deltaproteobacteria bacterium]|nr:alpha-ketoacid dehydrogenase subunit beta [Deltaproteobacteria bacterium]
MAIRSYLQAITDALREEMERDGNVILMGEDVGVYGGAFKVTEGLLEKFGPLRVIDTPISESLIGGAAVGAAVAGLRPVAEIQFMDFISCAFDQIVNMAATTRYRHGGQYKVPMVVRGPSGAGIHGGLFHSQNSEAWFARVPGLKVVCPATVRDAKGLLKSAIRDDDPVVYFEHKRFYRSVREELPDGDLLVPIGRAKVARAGKDLTLVTYGGTYYQSLEAADRIAREDKAEVEVIDLRTVLPIDYETVFDSVRRTGRLLIAHEDRATLGVGAEVAARVSEHCFEHLDAPVVRLGMAEAHNAYAPTLEEWLLPSTDKIVDKARQVLKY